MMNTEATIIYFNRNIFVKNYKYLILLIFKIHALNIDVLIKTNNINKL
jgi:hypothetical protein